MVKAQLGPDLTRLRWEGGDKDKVGILAAAAIKFDIHAQYALQSAVAGAAAVDVEQVDDRLGKVVLVGVIALHFQQATIEL